MQARDGRHRRQCQWETVRLLDGLAVIAAEGHHAADFEEDHHVAVEDFGAVDFEVDHPEVAGLADLREGADSEGEDLGPGDFRGDVDEEGVNRRRPMLVSVIKTVFFSSGYFLDGPF